MNIIPLGNKVLILPIEESDITLVGLYIPSANRNEPDRGRVISVGSGKFLESGKKQETEVKEGETVIFIKGAGIDIKLEGISYKILSENEILGVIEE